MYDYDYIKSEKDYSDFKRYSKTYRQLGDLEISDDFIKVPLL